MFFGKEDKPSVKTEAREVLILKFDAAQGDLVTADGATIPNEVAVYSQDRIVGRAILHLREDGIYADIMLSLGSMEGQGATAITIVKRDVRTLAGRRIIKEYEITAVDLVKETAKPEIEKTENVTPNTEKTIQPTNEQKA